MRTSMAKLCIKQFTARFFGRQRGKKYYLSIKQQLEHDFRMIEMEEDYLLYPLRCVENIYSGLRAAPKGTDIIDGLMMRANLIHKRAVADYEKHHKQKWQSKTNEFITGVLSFENEFMPSRSDRIKQHQEVGRFLKREYGYVISLVGHADELSWHYHYNVPAYDFKNHRQQTYNKNTYKLQDKIAAHLLKVGLAFGHTRGTPKEAQEPNFNSEHIGVRQSQQIYMDKQRDAMLKYDGSLGELQKRNNQGKEALNCLIKELQTFCNDLVELGSSETYLQNKLIIMQKYVERGHTLKLQNLIDRLADGVVVQKPTIEPPKPKP